MERSQCSGFSGTANRASALQMNSIERARAEEGMKHALLLANLTLAGVAHMRNALNSVARAMSLVYGRGRPQ